VFDLAISGGVVVTPRGRLNANVYVSDGTIAALSEETLPARESVDAGGLLVMAGMVEAHAHFMDPADPSREDFPTGSAAAAAAGVTTVLEHTHASPVVDADDLRAKVDWLADRSVVDFGLGAHAMPDRLDAVSAVWSAGAAFIKAFTCTTHGVPGFTPGPLRSLLERVAGAGAVCLVHCEDESLTEDAERALRHAGRDDPAIVAEWRSREAEMSALAVTLVLARSTRARVVLAHVSNADALALVARERAAGGDVAAESCPQYLCLLERELLVHGAFRKFTPPARARSIVELDEMWEALRCGDIQYISSDHAPSTREQKTAGSIWDVHFGLPGIDTTTPILLDAAAGGRISHELVAAAYSEAPARTYGLYPRKGSLAVGADADIVLVDPSASWEVRDEDVISRAGWTPYAGRTLVGGVARTYLRGRLVAQDRNPLGAPGGGRFVAGPGAAP
jgi:dihydroorotase (multifunctional complex type)